MFPSDHWHGQVPDEPMHHADMPGQTEEPNVVDLDPVFLPPRYRRQWNNKREADNKRALSPNPPILREEMDVIDETNVDNNGIGITSDNEEHGRADPGGIAASNQRNKRRRLEKQKENENENDKRPEDEIEPWESQPVFPPFVSKKTEKKAPNPFDNDPGLLWLKSQYATNWKRYYPDLSEMPEGWPGKVSEDGLRVEHLTPDYWLSPLYKGPRDRFGYLHGISAGNCFNLNIDCRSEYYGKEIVDSNAVRHAEHVSSAPEDVLVHLPETNIDNNGMASTGLDTDKREIYETDTSSESDSESDGSSLIETIPLISRPAESNVSTITVDLDHLNATARGVMNSVHASKPEIKRTTRRLVMTEGTVRHPLEGVTQVQIPRSAYNTARRVLVPESLELPLVSVSMRADLQFFHRQNRYRLSRYSLPNKVGYRHVVDATMISETAIVAYGAGPTQISLLQLIEGHRPALVDLPAQPHKSTLDPHKRGTITCLSPCTTNHNAMRFFTGGYDKGIRIWSGNVNQPASWNSKELFRTSTNPEALAFRGSRRTMLVACSKKLLEVHVDHLTQRPALIPMSNAIHQLHVHKEVENIIILEVDSLDHQIHLYDDRKKNGFDRTSDCYFGRRGRTAKHSKGDTRGNLFARGYDDGTVCVWDIRNAKQPILKKSFNELGCLVHTTFLNMDLVCYGRSGLTFLDISGSGS